MLPKPQIDVHPYLPKTVHCYLPTTGSYKNSNKVGVWEYYLEDGRLNKKIEYTEKGEKIILDNHLLPPTPSSMEPSSIMDSNNNAVVK